MLKKSLFAVLLTICLLIPGTLAEAPSDEHVGYASIYSSDNPIPEIVARVRPSVVEVAVYTESWDAVTRVASTTLCGKASGCYIRAAENGGYIVTNNHVATAGDVFKLIWADGTEMDATVCGTDNGTDLAVMAFHEPAPEGVEVIPFGDSDALVLGELVIAIGHPGVNGDQLVGTVTAGIVSGLHRPATSDTFSRGTELIQTDAAINVGNSGGALLNRKGELVGIPSVKYMYGNGAVFEGLGLCIPGNTAADVVEQLIEKGTVVRPRMGMNVFDADGPEEPMQKYAPAGLQVQLVEPNGSAEKAGIQANDVITAVNGVRCHNFMELSAELDKHKAGDTVELTICRYKRGEDEMPTGGYEMLTVEVRLEIID